MISRLLEGSIGRKIWIAVIAGAIFSSNTMAFAAAERCSGNGMSVWCHKYWFGYTKCNLYGPSGEMIQEFIDPADKCPQIA